MNDEHQDEPVADRKLFTIEEANASLPLVRAIVEDLARLSRDVLERRERLAAVPGNHDREGHDLYSEELALIQDELERDTEELNGYIEELRSLGIDPKNGLEGIVDFPSEMDGRIVYLCWKLGEPEILHWHELDAGFVGRHPLTAASMSNGPGSDTPAELDAADLEEPSNGS